MDAAIQAFISEKIGTDNFRVLQLAGDASARRYYRVNSGDKNWVLMSWEPFVAEKYPFLSVQNLFKSCGIKVPEIVGVCEQRGLILQEDLGDMTLERKFWENQNFSVVQPYYEQSITELLKIHFGSTRSKVDSTAHHLQFDTDKFMWEFNYTREHLLEKMGQLQLSEEDREMLKKSFFDIAERLHKEPKWITHRDYHSRNLMIKFDEIRVIDFQDARGGPIQYDLVSLLRDSYVNLTDSQVDSLLDYFWERARPELGLNSSKEHFLLMFELQTIQRCFKACGSFASFWNSRQDTRYLKHIQPTLKRVQKALLHFPEYREFASFLLDSGLADRKYE